ncbi:hypothetical protein D7D52_17960 [Nocardia yunnanensis]|uniref:DUF1345 domain-containing protein n=1 Tax=Nocardia yunnanensis TaxID=2382165 RepID=A0A386ZCV4_9NOCA|nr:hypothetical protein [Nocardia yunnanensis]AYF75430.1 hypothetical protein D7D52_17960 [Nocardia yunnanensis]
MSTAENKDDDQVPAWARHTAGESRWAATAAIVGILVMQYFLPAQFTVAPRWVVPGIGLVLMAVLVAASPFRLDREEVWLRRVSLGMMALLGIALVWSVYHLVKALIDGSVADNAAGLLTSGGAIWLTNVLVFALWYWDFDRGGPAARAHARKPYPDFLWVQMQNPDLADPEWEPEFPDYLYLSFTNATAFSPTDVMPMSRWAKTLMMVQSAVSLLTVSLVIARAVNVLK